MNRFQGDLALSPLADGVTWWLVAPFSYGETRIPRGFETDFASVPRVFQNVLGSWGKYGPAAIVHDWLYWTQRCARLTADDTLLEAMVALTVPTWQMALIYKAVREFGWIAWNDNARLAAQGYSRMHNDGAREKCWKRRMVRAALKGYGNG